MRLWTVAPEVNTDNIQNTACLLMKYFGDQTKARALSLRQTKLGYIGVQENMR